MAGIKLNIDNLLLDLQNPRITRSSSQREVLQKIIEDQDLKLVVLAESIVSDGLNPMDRWLVVKSPDEHDIPAGRASLPPISRHLLTLINFSTANMWSRIVAVPPSGLSFCFTNTCHVFISTI